MTYCLSLLCQEGIVFISDSRTNAGVDHVNVRPKMRVYTVEGDRLICLMTSGNLSLTQSVVALIEEDLMLAKNEPTRPNLMNQPTLYETTRYVGAKVRQVDRLDRAALAADGFGFNINLLIGGQIAGQPPEIHYVYPQGNSLKANRESPFLQIGESKYGKPLLDRGFTFETRLSEAVKFGILSMEATMKSNIAVGPPLDVLAYRADSLCIEKRYRIEHDDPYLREIQQAWGNGLVKLVEAMPSLPFPGTPQPGAFEIT
ncbi:MAG: putative proteasome-type protease [Chthoniobacteraceae bacterium]|nr:putative proteasome-type protease [Chthoniobacteraceae bacterium]